MRNPFDARKESKSIKLVKKLQDEADKEWKNEIDRRREQELNDEAIAKELQAQLEQESGSSSMPSPPPLPMKPRVYNSSINISSNAASLTSTANHSTHSLSTASSSSSSFAITPLYSMTSNGSQQSALPPRDQNASKRPVKSYLTPERYKPELQFALASPSPCPSSVFHQKTPTMAPAISPLPALKTAKTSTAKTKSNNNTPLTSQKFPFNSENNGNNNTAPGSPIVMQSSLATFNTQPSRPASTQPSSRQPVINRMEMPMPTDVNPTNFQPIATTSSVFSSSLYSNRHPPSSSPPQYLSHNSDPIVLPLSQQQQAVTPVAPPNPLYQNQQQHESNASYFPPPQQQQQQQQQEEQHNYSYQPIRQSTPSPAVSLSLNSNAICQHSNYSQQQQQHPPTHQPQYLFNSVYQATPPPPQQQYQSIVSASSSSGFRLPSTSAFASSSIDTSAAATTKQNSRLAPTNPYYNMQDEKKPEFSKSIISLKPDEEQPHELKDEDEDEDEDDDDWDNFRSEKTSHRPPTPIVRAAITLDADDDKESEIDYSDMIYDRRKETTEEKEIAEDEQDEDEDWEDSAIDPFDDDFAVHVPKGSTATSAIVAGDFRKQRASSIVTSLAPTIQILDPTITIPPASSPPSLEEKVAVEENVPQQELFEHNTRHQHVEKESTEIEHGLITSMTRQSMGLYLPPTASATHTPVPSFYQPSQTQGQHHHHNSYYNRPQSAPLIELDLPEDKQSKVYPTKILKSGAPPLAMSANNPYVKKQGIVPATDYGYFKEDDPVQKKTLPELPKSANDDRHITVSSINPGQRVWIRIHPTDTGKDLAERIHIVASYQTRRVTKITTKNGRSISLDNKPLFDNWNEIISFKEGEKWTVDWVPIEHPYVDIITEGKEFMKQLKANFRGSSSK